MMSGGQLLEQLKWLSSDFLPSVHPSSAWPMKRTSKNSFMIVALPVVCKDDRDCLDTKDRISTKDMKQKSILDVAPGCWKAGGESLFMRSVH